MSLVDLNEFIVVCLLNGLRYKGVVADMATYCNG
jgi:hypothetical protein